MRPGTLVLVSVLFACGSAAAGGDMLDGEIVFPTPGSCFGLSDLPVRLIDDFEGEDLERTLTPPPEGRFRISGGTRGSLGWSTDFDGSTLVAATDDEFGRIHFFERQADGSWAEQVLTPSGRSRNDRVGDDVAIHGDLAVLSASADDEAGSQNGAAYVFRRGADGVWFEAQKLFPADPLPLFQFGYSVAVHGTTIVVGSFGYGLSVGSGIAYVFEFDGSRWSESWQFVSPGGRDGFSHSVAIHEDTIAVSASQFGGASLGSVYLYDRQGDGWVLNRKLLPPRPRLFEQFGTDVDFDGPDRLAATSRYGAEIFERDAMEGWRPAESIQLEDFGLVRKFPTAVALEGDVLALGMPRDGDPGLERSGAAYAFRRDGRWNLERTLNPRTPRRNGRFARGVSIEDGVLAVGSPGDFSLLDPAVTVGALYLYEEDSLGAYSDHGDWEVLLQVRDSQGRQAEDSTFFTIDRIPPAVELHPSLDDPQILRRSIPLAPWITSTDDDLATGGVVRERIYVDGCLVLDGATDGDRDGLLTDESFALDDPLLCQARAECGLDRIRVPAVRLVVEDCGGNRGVVEQQVDIGFDVDATTCP